MKRLVFAVFLMSPVVVLAQSALDGTWKVDLQSGQFSGKPTVQSLQNGMYRCDTCTPKIDVKADGQDHARKNDPYADTVSVREINDHSVESIFKKDGKVISKDTDTASDDGNTLTSEWSFISASGQAGNGKAVSKRVGAAPAGANKISGSWQQEKLENASESIVSITFKATNDGLSMSNQLGASYTAKFDGKDYPYKGDPGVTSVSLKKIDSNTIEETDKRNGKAIAVVRLAVGSDGKTMAVDGEDKLAGQTFKWKATKE